MNIYWVSHTGAEPRPLSQLQELLQREDGFAWLDIPVCDEEATSLLLNTFGFHSLAVQACKQRSYLPKVHAYANHLFVALQVPEGTDNGHVQLFELDQFVGKKYLVTVHEPPEEAASVEATMRETRSVLQRVQSGRNKPKMPIELSYIIVTAFVRRAEALVTTLAEKVTTLEQKVIGGKMGNPEEILEEMFRLRHELLTVRTLAAHSREGYARITSLAPRLIPVEDHYFLNDLVDQFDRVKSLCEGVQQFLQGVIDFYQNRTITKLNIAMERLALITVLLLPVTAIASIYGMNLIVSQHTQMAHLIAVLVLICFLMILVFRWAKRQGWW